jgi:hypothetical protein
MKQKIFEPARHNEESPAEGMAAVNTFNEQEAPLEEMIAEQSEQDEVSADQGRETEAQRDSNRQ